MKSFLLLLFLVTLVPAVSYFIFAPLLKSFHISPLLILIGPKHEHENHWSHQHHQSQPLFLPTVDSV